MRLLGPACRVFLLGVPFDRSKEETVLLGDVKYLILSLKN